MLPEPGARFDRYRIEAKLGEGGMGRVYRAFDERLQRRVALKILHPAPDGSVGDSRASQGAAQLLREARAAAALDHPNAIAVFDVGAAGADASGEEHPFIAMELIEGRSLRAFIGFEATPLTERLRWLTDVARAVAAAHRRGLVHRDIKPENVMIRDEDGVVKVLDFGIARRTRVDVSAATKPAQSGTLTGGGAVVGTPFYMAPEQMRGEAVDGRADQFSWGVLAYELLSGRLPWGRDVDPLIVISQILTSEAAQLHTIAPAVPAHIEATIHKALAKSANDRFALMDDIVRILDPQTSRTPASLPKKEIESLGSAPTVASTKTSLASAPVRPSSVPAPSRRKRRWLAPTAMGLVIAAAGLVGFARRMHPAASATDAAAPAPTTLLDLPLPKTAPDALAVYVDAMHELRLGDGGEIAARLKRAVELDPQLAPALLRLARRVLSGQPTNAREFFRRAKQLQASLTARDQQLLEGFEPLFDQEPADAVEARRRLMALTARYPLDAELAFELARIDEQADALELALAEYRRAVELDPGYAYALIGEAGVLLALGDTAHAVEATRECDRVAPGVTNCQMLRTLIERQEGRCADLEDDARKMILIHPSASAGYGLVAEALASTGSPPGTVREAISQARARMTEGEQVLPQNALLEADGLVEEGAFGDAKALLLARESDPAVRDSSQELDHASVAWARVQLAIETGHDEEATEIASDFRARSRVWSHPPNADFWIWKDARLPMLAMLARERRIPSEELESVRRAMLGGVGNTRDVVLWFGAYAWPAATAPEATVALDALPRFEPLRSTWEFPAEYSIGRVFLLAGRIDEALPYLLSAANACDALSNPFDHVRASLLLGQALEAKRDVAGACKAYQRVVSQWGNAKPRSVTASAARARLSALTCP